MPENTSHAEATMQSDFDMPQKSNKQTSGAMRWVTVIVLVVVILLGGLYLLSKYSSFNVLGFSTTSNDYEAVFLTNGQVYFGKVNKNTRDRLVLSEIYYLQITQPLQRSASDQAQAVGSQNELALIKLGDELHGPRDRMYINQDHVLFTETLKAESKVVQAIEQHKASQGN